MLGTRDNRTARIVRRHAVLLARLDELARQDGYGSAFAATSAKSIRAGHEPTVTQLRVMRAVCARSKDA